MKAVLAGGSGQVGRVLARAFLGEGHQVVVLSRKPAAAPWPVVAWDGHSLGNWANELEGADVEKMVRRVFNRRLTQINADFQRGYR